MLDLQLESGPWADVRAYGALGDGSTDDSAAIQAAITAMTGGGVVFFPAGVYPCRELYMTSYVTLRGIGLGSKLVRNGDPCVLYTNGATNVQLQDLRFDVASSEVTFVDGTGTIQNTGGSKWLIRGCTFSYDGARERAVYTGPSTSGASFFDLHVESCIVHNT